jgi:hypothetical protein
LGSFPLPKKKEKEFALHEKENKRAMPDEIPKKLIHIDAARREREKKKLKQ